jgi:hypothetical protein
VSAADEIAALDRALLEVGQNAILRRTVGTTSQTHYDVVVRVWAVGFAPSELTPEIIQGDTKVILSPTQINEAGWPGAGAGSGGGDQRVPRRGDKFIIQGTARTVLATMPPYYVDGTLVRLEAQVRGQQ